MCNEGSEQSYLDDELLDFESPVLSLSDCPRTTVSLTVASSECRKELGT